MHLVFVTLSTLWGMVATAVMHSHVLWLPIKEYTEIWISDHHATRVGHTLSVFLHFNFNYVSAIL